jgi:hypothetical protein
MMSYDTSAAWSRHRWLVPAAVAAAVAAFAAFVIAPPDRAEPTTPTGDDVPSRVAAVNRSLSEQLDAASIPGAAVAITHGDQVVHVAGFGHDSDGAAVTGETLFRVASLSKSITALAVMQLVDEHQLRLDDRVVDHLPEFRLADPRGADITFASSSVRPPVSRTRRCTTSRASSRIRWPTPWSHCVRCGSRPRPGRSGTTPTRTTRSPLGSWR